MIGHDIMVIGTSAGGLKALSTVLAALPADLKASVFVVQHRAPNSPSLLAEQTQHVEDVLWSTVKALEEKVTFVRQLAAQMQKEHSHQAAQEHAAYADRVDGEVKIIRELILHGIATQRTIGVESDVGDDA